MAGGEPRDDRHAAAAAAGDQLRQQSNCRNSHGDGPIAFPDPSTITLKNDGQPFRIDAFDATGGNVDFCPTARRDYDLKNTQQVYSSIEHFGLRDGPGGEDRKELSDVSRFRNFLQFSPDCQGPWLVYWFQNLIGPDTPARDDEGRSLKNRWPFLFY